MENFFEATWVLVSVLLVLVALVMYLIRMWKCRPFKNPRGLWKYEGAFSVELAEGVLVSRLPDSVTLSGRMIQVPKGSAAQSIRGVQMYFGGVAFFLGWYSISAIYKPNGKPFWINPRCPPKAECNMPSEKV